MTARKMPPYIERFSKLLCGCGTPDGDAQRHADGERGPGDLYVVPRGVEHCPRIEDGAVIGDELFRYRSDAHPYEKWKDPEGNVFRAALEHGYQSIAERVAGELAAKPR